MSRRADAGFSLIEALAAATIAALVLVAVMQSLTGAARLSAAASTRAAAVQVAQSVLAGPATAGSGQSADYTWTRRVDVVEQGPTMQLLRVTVDITGPGVTRPVALSRLKVTGP